MPCNPGHPLTRAQHCHAITVGLTPMKAALNKQGLIWASGTICDRHVINCAKSACRFTNDLWTLQPLCRHVCSRHSNGIKTRYGIRYRCWASAEGDRNRRLDPMCRRSSVSEAEAKLEWFNEVHASTRSTRLEQNDCFIGCSRQANHITVGRSFLPRNPSLCSQPLETVKHG